MMRSFGVYRSGVLTAVVSVSGLLFVAPAFAKSGPIWSIQSVAAPTSMHTSESSGAKTNDEYSLHVEDIGDTASSGEITVTDKLPEGVTTTAKTPIAEVGKNEHGFVCSSGAGQSEVTCTGSPAIPAGVTQSYDTVPNPPFSVLKIAIPVKVAEGASGNGINIATVSGGGAMRSAAVSTENPLNPPTPSAFGVAYFNALVSDEVGRRSRRRADILTP